MDSSDATVGQKALKLHEMYLHKARLKMDKVKKAEQLSTVLMNEFIVSTRRKRVKKATARSANNKQSDHAVLLQKYYFFYLSFQSMQYSYYVMRIEYLWLKEKAGKNCY